MRQNLLKIARGKQILILAVSAEEAGHIRTKWNHAKMIRAREIERGAGEPGRQPFAFERRRHFCVLQHEAVWEAAIRNQRAKPVHGGLEPMGLFIVGNSYVVEV